MADKLVTLSNPCTVYVSKEPYVDANGNSTSRDPKKGGVPVGYLTLDGRLPETGVKTATIANPETGEEEVVSASTTHYVTIEASKDENPEVFFKLAGIKQNTKIEVTWDAVPNKVTVLSKGQTYTRNVLSCRARSVKILGLPTGSSVDRQPAHNVLITPPSGKKGK